MRLLIDQSISLQQKVEKLLQKLFELQAENVALKSRIVELEQIDELNVMRVEGALEQVNQILASLSVSDISNNESEE